jgi:phosphoenolpyruvate phosphomutase
MIYDADTGGQPEHLHYTVQSLERNGISAAIIEDKTGLKRNSLLGNDVVQTQSGIQEFCEKISSGVNSKLSSDFMLIARIESLILDKPVSDALTRADAYLGAGADGIMIHSRNKSGEDIKNFLFEFRKNHVNTPLVVVPTSFNHISASELADMGVNIVIYANQLLRAAYPAMLNAAQNILKFDKSMNIEKELMSIPDILKLIPGGNLDK